MDFKYACDYAKSDRASCKKCHVSIRKDSLRIAIMIQSKAFDGKIPNWHHFKCFFDKFKIDSISQIKDFDSLRADDQQRIEEKIQNPFGDAENKNSWKLMKLNANTPKECVTCKESIVKGSLLTQNSTRKIQVYHLKCFASQNFDVDFEWLVKISSLKTDDKDFAIKELLNTKKDANLPAKLEKKISPMERKIKEQNQNMWKIIDTLEETVSKNALVGLLEFNDQYVPKGEKEILLMLGDTMYFGALKGCLECDQKAPLLYKDNKYKCTGKLDEWNKCSFTTTDPKRKVFGVPKEYYDNDFLKNYKCTIRKRILLNEITISGDRIFHGICFAIPKNLTMIFYNDESPEKKKRKTEQNYDLENIKDFITSKGAVLTNKPIEGCFILLTVDYLEKKELIRKDSIMKTAIEKNLSALNMDMIVEIMKLKSSKNKITRKTVNSFVESYKISKLGKYIHLLTDKDVERDSVKSSTIKSLGSAAVDPNSGLEDKAIVYIDSRYEVPFNAVLTLTNLEMGVNSYYKLQILKGKKFHLYRAWGRIGTDIGGDKLETYSVSEAIENFEKIFYEKTGNHWAEFVSGSYKKISNKFVPLQIDYVKPKDIKSKKNIQSKLEKNLAKLIEFLFDVDVMEKLMIEYKIDLKKMPLGKISKEQLKETLLVLGLIANILNKGSIDRVQQNLLIGESNRFYSLLPHDFGDRTPPIIDSLEEVNKKFRIVQDLIELEVAHKIISNSNDNENLIDQNYHSLKINLKCLNPNHEEFKTINQYLQLTHGPTHDYNLKVKAIFSIERSTENFKFNEYKNKIGNTMLLWHGSRRTNWPGILSNGLKIAPKEAPVTGYMFGKGVYFADMATKSANYCYPSQSQPEGILLLSEVVLGKEKICYKAEDGELDPTYNSRHGIGRTIPDPEMYKADSNDCIIPMGKPVKRKISKEESKKFSLEYNEFIVYDINQIKQRYLLWIEFCEKD